jgi:hypothetical protein
MRFVYLSIRIFVDDVLSKKVKPSGMCRAQKSFSMDSIAIISQRNWTPMQLAPHQNSSIDLLQSSNIFCRTG